MNREISLATDRGPLRGRLAIPSGARGLVLLPQLHGLPPDRVLAATLALGDHAVLTMDLLTAREAQFPDACHNVPLLTRRLIEALDLLRQDGDTALLPVGLFAQAHVTPAALRAAARRDAQVRAVACHGGLVDLAGVQNLRLLAAPLLMLVDTDDGVAAAAFQRAEKYISAPHLLLRPSPMDDPGSPVARWFGEDLQAI